MPTTDTQTQPSEPKQNCPKSGKTTLLLCIFLGVLGAHRFYVKKYGTGVLMLLTFGMFGLWSFIDAITLINNAFQDKEGNVLTTIKDPTATKKVLYIILSGLGQLFILISSIMLLAFSLTHVLVETIERQITALRRNDIETSYSLTSKAFQQGTSIEKFKAFVKAYPILQEQVDLSFNKREIKDNLGIVSGTLTKKNGISIRIKYLLIKENNQWKVLAIIINPKEEEATPPLIEIKTEKTFSNVNNPHQDNTEQKELFIYNDPQQHFSAACFKQWSYGSNQPGSFFCTGKKGTPSHHAYISIHMMEPGKSKNISINEYITHLKRHIQAIDPKAIFIDQGIAQLPTDPQHINGQYLMSTFTYQQQPFKRLEFVLSKNPKAPIITWSYTATSSQFDKDLPLVKQLYERLMIKNE